ncbi:hypothetical protein UA08_06227 [Talaromyces atroroseus]|uniref:DNA2/NAM7 helicase-like C-terminal domain-containing protein n=1 Tax=Talaromyces atroroseus TaxID=1441469 RepID=A0A225AY01_TALAT|nr:hypothetical protein UA08_06227 [Talaromyces atroroseus]OKL58367.1 hypothetical protein UA08_06227 [Talaromyces atroroseus]
MYDEDNQQGLKTRNSERTFKRKYEVVRKEYLQTEVRILATTLSNSAHESLQDISPDYVVCDDSSQCLEGDHMIAMTKPSVKVVVLIGDPQQLPSTLISENKENLGIKYVKRSLMERLREAGYPCTMLSTNYRCHPHILDFFNEVNICGTPSGSTSQPPSKQSWKHSAQGQEADMVIYMLVKLSKDANRIGFVADKARLNVALSRAKKVLIIIGNSTIWDKA